MSATNLLNQILTTYFGAINPSTFRILSANIFNGEQNFKAPKTDDPYIIISLRNTKIIGSKVEFNGTTESQYVASAESYDVDIASRGTFARDSRNLLITALDSYISTRIQEDNNIRIFSRAGDMIDLSAIDGSSSLHKYRLPVIVNILTEASISVDYYDQFRTAEEVAN